MSDYQTKLLAEIGEERERQKEEWDTDHDDKHDVNDWVALIARHSGKATHVKEGEFRKQMIRVAALALAAVEWVDRIRYEAEVGHDHP